MWDILGWLALRVQRVWILSCCFLWLAVSCAAHRYPRNRIRSEQSSYALSSSSTAWQIVFKYSILTAFDNKGEIKHLSPGKYRGRKCEKWFFPTGSSIKAKSALRKSQLLPSRHMTPLTSCGELSPLRNSSVAILLLFLKRHRLVAAGACWASLLWCIVGCSPVDATSVVMTRLELRFSPIDGWNQRFLTLVSICWSTVSVCTSSLFGFWALCGQLENRQLASVASIQTRKQTWMTISDLIWRAHGKSDVLSKWISAPSALGGWGC